MKVHLTKYRHVIIELCEKEYYVNTTESTLYYCPMSRVYTLASVYTVTLHTLKDETTDDIKIVPHISATHSYLDSDTYSIDVSDTLFLRSTLITSGKSACYRILFDCEFGDSAYHTF